MRKQSEILDELYKLTNAKIVKPTAEEARQIQELQEQNLRSRKDQIMMQAVNEKRKREEAILIQARGEVEAAREN
jgi:large subunit ribosomal protein MRP49